VGGIAWVAEVFWAVKLGVEESHAARAKRNKKEFFMIANALA